jgi:hypothetical protein
MDYIVRDSSLYQDPDVFSVYDRRDSAIRVGIVREERETSEGTTRYIVEVFIGGNQVPVSCTLMTRFGGIFNYEEFRVRPWLKTSTGGMLPPSTASSYDLRSGDTVLVAFVDGKSREGVILGGIKHPGRDEQTSIGDIAYISVFNGLETKIENSGAYKVTFNGKPINDVLLDVPIGQPLPAPQYNPLVAGSYFGFEDDGSFTASDGSQMIKITKNPVSGSISIESGKNKMVFGGNPALGKTTLETDTLIFKALSTSIGTTKDFKLETLQLSLKGAKIAIGNDAFELFDGLVQLIDALGSLVVTSPVGTCTPLQAAPTWAAQVLPLKLKIQTLKASLASPDSP